MNREIKFRAWIKQAKTMIDTGMPDWSIMFSNTGTVVELWCNDGPMDSFCDDDFELMQYTGLKDKNGTDICEGDLIGDHVGKGIVKYSDRHGAFRVVYGDGLAKWFYDYYLRGERESIEVIGNIYEHPELLTDEA